jgi:ribonucleotide monophosphatase NagD (HAD superfamily)
LHKHGAAKHPLVIGDGLETDILGANRMKLDALFIVGGIHSALIDDPSGIAKLLTESGARAKAIMPALAW